MSLSLPGPFLFPKIPGFSDVSPFYDLINQVARFTRPKPFPLAERPSKSKFLHYKSKSRAFATTGSENFWVISDDMKYLTVGVSYVEDSFIVLQKVKNVRCPIS